MFWKLSDLGPVSGNPREILEIPLCWNIVFPLSLLDTKTQFHTNKFKQNKYTVSLHQKMLISETFLWAQISKMIFVQHVS